MNFNFFKWLHDEVTALRAAVARLETHTSSPESKPVPKPADLPADFGPPPVSGNAPPPRPAGPAAPAVPVPLPPGGNTTDPTAPGFIMPAHVDPAPAAAGPVVDTSGDVLDFAVVGNWKPIDMDGVSHKTIINCPASVSVHIAQHSGQVAGDFTVTINGEEHHGTGVTPQDNIYSTAAQDGKVDISIAQDSNFHLQMIVRG